MDTTTIDRINLKEIPTRYTHNQLYNKPKTSLQSNLFYAITAATAAKMSRPKKMTKFRLDEAARKRRSVLRKSIITNRTSLSNEKKKNPFVVKPGRGNFASTLYTKKEKKRRKMHMIVRV